MEKSILAQVAPAATTETTLYQVPQGKSAFIDAFNIATLSAGTVSFRFSISKAGAATSQKDYLYYNVDITTKDAMRDDFKSDKTLGLRLESLDIIRVYASTNELAFNLFGTEEGFIS